MGHTGFGDFHEALHALVWLVEHLVEDSVGGARSLRLLPRLSEGFGRMHERTKSGGSDSGQAQLSARADWTDKDRTLLSAKASDDGWYLPLSEIDVNHAGHSWGPEMKDFGQ